MSAHVSVAIMAHPARKRFIPALQAALDRDAEVVWDRWSDRWDTGSRSMLAYTAEATHHLVVQDDAIVCRDLVAGLEQALNALSDQRQPTPLCLYLSKHSPYLQRSHTWPSNVTWLRKTGMASGVGIVMPVELIEPAIAWGNPRRDIKNYDTRIGRFLQSQSVLTWHPWPSLVDHRNSPSLVAGRGQRGRYASRFLGVDNSALDVDWAGGEVRDIAAPIRQRRVIRAGVQRGSVRRGNGSSSS